MKRRLFYFSFTAEDAEVSAKTLGACRGQKEKDLMFNIQDLNLRALRLVPSVYECDSASAGHVLRGEKSFGFKGFDRTLFRIRR